MENQEKKERCFYEQLIHIAKIQSIPIIILIILGIILFLEGSFGQIMGITSMAAPLFIIFLIPRNSIAVSLQINGAIR